MNGLHGKDSEVEKEDADFGEEDVGRIEGLADVDVLDSLSADWLGDGRGASYFEEFRDAIWADHVCISTKSISGN